MVVGEGVLTVGVNRQSWKDFILDSDLPRKARRNPPFK